ncbi:hypothetical protein CR513_53460, partial [Mucuna pruriens]
MGDMRRIFLEEFILALRIAFKLLIQYFYERMMLMDKSMIDVASGGALIDKTLVVARNLISNMTKFSVRRPTSFKVVNEPLDNTILVHHLERGIFSSRKHPTYACPTLQETNPNSAKVTRMINDELLQTFSEVEINIHILNSIKQILKYAKSLKELCMHKRKKLKGNVEIGRNVSILIKSDMLCKRSAKIDTFTIPYTIGRHINIMPSLVYKSLIYGTN